MTLVFETERLNVRLLVREDFEKLHAICSDPEVMKFVGNLKPYKERQTRQVILKSLRSYYSHGFGGWALLDKQNDEFTGYGGFEFVIRRDMPELFYIFPQAHWGKGLASEFALAAVSHAAKKLNVKRIGASFDPENHTSMKVARKAGLTFSHDGFDEYNLPTVYYELALSPECSV